MKGKVMIINKTILVCTPLLITLLSWGSYEVPPCPLDLRLDVNTFSIKSTGSRVEDFLQLE